jgi:hypothetical protein
MLLGIESLLVPPLYGQIEKDRRLLSKRQLSISDWALLILKEFFHAEGQEMGLPLRLLETPKYLELTSLVSHIYHGEISRLRREYEMSILGGRWNKEKKHILKLIRLRAEKTEDANEADALKLWFETQLVSRKEKI